MNSTIDDVQDHSAHSFSIFVCRIALVGVCVLWVHLRKLRQHKIIQDCILKYIVFH